MSVGSESASHTNTHTPRDKCESIDNTEIVGSASWRMESLHFACVLEYRQSYPKIQ